MKLIMMTGLLLFLICYASYAGERKDGEEYFSAASEKHYAEVSPIVGSQFIVVATYEGYREPTLPMAWMNPPEALYHLDRCLKGANLPKTFPVRYQFDSFDARLYTPDYELHEGAKLGAWHFDGTKMPTKGSKWILFIVAERCERDICGSRVWEYQTYRGMDGRLPYSTDNLARVTKLVKENSIFESPQRRPN